MREASLQDMLTVVPSMHVLARYAGPRNHLVYLLGFWREELMWRTVL